MPTELGKHAGATLAKALDERAHRDALGALGLERGPQGLDLGGRLLQRELRALVLRERVALREGGVALRLGEHGVVEERRQAAGQRLLDAARRQPDINLM